MHARTPLRPRYHSAIIEAFTAGGHSRQLSAPPKTSNRCTPLITGSSPEIIILAAPLSKSGRRDSALRFKVARWGRDGAYVVPMLGRLRQEPPTFPSYVAPDLQARKLP